MNGDHWIDRGPSWRLPLLFAVLFALTAARSLWTILNGGEVESHRLVVAALMGGASVFYFVSWRRAVGRRRTEEETAEGRREA